jgi:hypothetical protein
MTGGRNDRLADRGAADDGGNQRSAVKLTVQRQLARGWRLLCQTVGEFLAWRQDCHATVERALKLGE